MRPDLCSQPQYVAQFIEIIARMLEDYHIVHRVFAEYAEKYPFLVTKNVRRMNLQEMGTYTMISTLTYLYLELETLIRQMKAQVHRMSFSSDITDQIDELWHLSNMSIDKINASFENL